MLMVMEKEKLERAWVARPLPEFLLGSMEIDPITLLQNYELAKSPGGQITKQISSQINLFPGR